MSLKDSIEKIKNIKKAIEQLHGYKEEVVMQRDLLQKQLFEANQELSRHKVQELQKRKALYKKIAIIGIVALAVLAAVAIIPAMAVFAEGAFFAGLFAVAKAMPFMATALGYFAGLTILHANVILASLGLGSLVAGVTALFANRQVDNLSQQIETQTSLQLVRDKEQKAMSVKKLLVENQYDVGRKVIEADYAKGIEQLLADYSKPFNDQKDIINNEKTQRRDIDLAMSHDLRELSRRELQSRQALRQLRLLPTGERVARWDLEVEREKDLAQLQQEINQETQSKFCKQEQQARQVLQNIALSGLDKLGEHAHRPLREQQQLQGEQQRARGSILTQQQQEHRNLIQRAESHQAAIEGLNKLPVDQDQGRKRIVSSESQDVKNLFAQEKNSHELAKAQTRVRVEREQRLAAERELQRIQEQEARRAREVALQAERIRVQIALEAERLRQQQVRQTQPVQMGRPVPPAHVPPPNVPPPGRPAAHIPAPSTPAPAYVARPVRPSAPARPASIPMPAATNNDGGARFMAAFNHVNTDRRAEVNVRAGEHLAAQKNGGVKDAFAAGFARAVGR